MCNVLFLHRLLSPQTQSHLPPVNISTINAVDTARTTAAVDTRLQQAFAMRAMLDGIENEGKGKVEIAASAALDMHVSLSSAPKAAFFGALA